MPDTPSSANHGLTLRQGRWNFEAFGACCRRFVENVVPKSAHAAYRNVPRRLNDDRVFVIDCGGLDSEEAFWAAYLEVVKPEGSDGFGRNLDAFRDALNGGPGWPGACVIYLIHTGSIRQLGLGCFFESLCELAEESESVSLFPARG